MKAPNYNPELSRQTVSEQLPNQLAASELVSFLDNQELHQEVTNGNVTLAMIRPNLGPSTNLKGTDLAIADEIESHIGNMGVLAKFSIVFDYQAVNMFYDGTPKQVQVGQPAMRDGDYGDRWEEFVGIMTDGPTTVLLLHSPKGTAIADWRKQVGHWNIEANRDPETIRGKFGIDNYNNLVHGSDAPEAVLNELGIIKDCLRRQVA